MSEIILHEHEIEANIQNMEGIKPAMCSCPEATDIVQGPCSPNLAFAMQERLCKKQDWTCQHLKKAVFTRKKGLVVCCGYVTPDEVAEDRPIQIYP